jgi:hypothetical protein
LFTVVHKPRTARNQGQDAAENQQDLDGDWSHNFHPSTEIEESSEIDDVDMYFETENANDQNLSPDN